MIDTNIFVPLKVIGGREGTDFEFCEVNKNGHLVEKIGVWAGASQIKAIEVKLANGETKTFGKYEDDQKHPYKEYVFTPGETITKLSLWGNGAGTRAGAIKFFTSTGKEFDHGMTQWGRKREYGIDVGSGVFCGVVGKAGEDVDALGFVFLRKIKSSTLKDVRYEVLQALKANTQPETLDSQTFTNESSIKQTYHLGGEKRVLNSESWSNGTNLEFSLTPKLVEVEVFKIFKVGGEFMFKLVKEKKSERNKTEIVIRRWNFPIECPPQKTVRGEATIRHATMSTPYTGKIVVELENGRNFSFETKGIYENVSWTDVEVYVREVEGNNIQPLEGNTNQSQQQQAA